MYRNRRGMSFRNLLNLILLGAIAGIIFLIFDSIQNAPTPQPTASVVSSAPTDVALPTATTSPLTADILLPTPTLLPLQTVLVIPSAAVNAPVIDVYLSQGTWDVSLLGTNVGHLQGTARPGEVGNVVLSGHVELRDGTKGAFGFLNQISVGDRVILREGDRQTQYVIIEIYNTTPDDLRPVYPTITPRLTLITCDNYDFFSNSYLERTIIVAEPLGQVS